MSLWAFRRDFLEKVINKKELTQMITLVNSDIMGNKNDTRISLTYKGFEHFLI